MNIWIASSLKSIFLPTSFNNGRKFNYLINLWIIDSIQQTEFARMNEKVMTMWSFIAYVCWKNYFLLRKNERCLCILMSEFDWSIYLSMIFFFKLFFETIIILNYSYNWLNWIYVTLSLLSPFTTSWNGIRMDRNAAMGERIDCGTGIWADWRNRNCIKYFLVYVYDSANAI